MKTKSMNADVRPAGDGTLRFVLSDGQVDRDGDTIDPNGWDLTAFRRNPVVLWAHSHQHLPIGKCLSVQVVNNQLVGQVKFAEHPFAKEVHELYRGGFLSAVSVGFRSLDHAPNAHGGINFRRQELMEFSAVPVPANSRALLAAAADGVSTKQLRAWAAATLADDGDDVVVELLDDDGDEDVSATFADDVVAAARAVSRLKHPERLVRLDAPEVFDVDDPHALAREVAVGVRAALRELISVETRRAIRAASGRLD